MPKRILAALGVVLAFAAVLVVVPLATADEAEAHTQAIKRCAYDPFAGQQCWYETVAHNHPPPTPREQIEPQGPDLNIEPGPTPTTAPPPANTQPPPPTTAAPPPTTAPPPPTTTIYVPPTTTTTAPPRCATGYHRNGSTCHPNHGDPPCGTGLWTPHAGHSPQQRPPCRVTTCPAGTHRHTVYRGKLSACGPDHPDPPCGTGYWWRHHAGHSVRQPPCDPTLPKCPLPYAWSSSKKVCELTGAVRITQDVGKVILAIEGEVVCTFAAGGIATKVTNAILKGVSEAAKIVARHTFEAVLDHPCDAVWDALTKWGNDSFYQPDTTEPYTDKDGIGDDSDGDGTGDDAADDDGTGDDAADDNSAGNYCGPWTASAFGGRPGRGGVTLFVNGAAYGEYQSSYGNRDWAIARCQEVLAGLGQ